MSSWTKEYTAIWRKAHPGYWREQARNRIVAIGELKVKAGCVDCGFNAHPAALDFDHVRGDKFSDVSRMLTYSWERILSEIAKCDVVCANCHRLRTISRPQSTRRLSCANTVGQ